MALLTVYIDGCWHRHQRDDDKRADQTYARFTAALEVHKAIKLTNFLLTRMCEQYINQ